ncbi:MAG: bifunctional diguanylate cyclase/phosphodiesterase [Lachnospiraceae bacterium]|nr:bifunctional diguanylate cyclase/phosphodiesterase [Lachnospiraceae bacterium]
MTDNRISFLDMDRDSMTGHIFELVEEKKDVNAVIDILLEETGKYFGLDDICIKEVIDEGTAIKVNYEWSMDGQKLLLNLERRFLDGVFEQWKDTFEKNPCFVYCYNQEEDDHLLIHMIRTNKVRSVLQIPYYEQEELRGFIEFSDYVKCRKWKNEDIIILKEFTHIVFSYLFDMREVDVSQKHLKELLKTDSITGLPRYEEFFKECVKAATASDDLRMAIICADITNFKYINERYGYEFGDQILVLFSRCIYQYYTRVISCCREYSDNFCFAIKLQNGLSEEAIKNNVNGLAAFFISRVQEEVIDSNLIVNLGVSIMQENDLDVAAAVSNANAARKFARKQFSKSYGKVALFDRSMLTSTARELEMIGRVDDALSKGEFCMFLQPKVQCRDFRIMGAEALVRWKKPDGGFNYPDSFIPAFERDGCIVKIDYFIYEEVMKYLRKRLDAGLECVPISMNVSRVHLFGRELIEYVGRLMNKYRIPPQYLEFELTESMYIEDLPTILYTIDRLKAMGLAISIDDFGSGYSSLDILTSLQADVLKLDKVFMKDELSGNDKIIVGAIIDMARRLGLTVLCEGVENEAQRQFLNDAGCEFMQGYLFSKPVEVEEFDALFRRNRDEVEPAGTLS